MKRSDYKKNIQVYFLDYILSFFYLPIAVWTLIWGRYMTFTQVGIILSSGFILDSILQLPTGALADLIGRKRVVVVARFCKFFAVFLMIFARDFRLFFIANLFDTLSESLYSGSGEALIYDSLKENGQEPEVEKVESKGYLLATLGFVLASTIGGFLYSVNPSLPYIGVSVVFFFNILNVLRYQEPQLDSVKFHVKAYIQKNIDGLAHIFRNKEIALVSLYSMTISFVFLSGLWILYQKSSTELGFSSTVVGIMISGFYLSRAFGTWLFPHLKKKIGADTFAIFLALFQAAASFLIAVPIGVVAIAGLAFRYVSDGFRQPFFISFQNKHLDSKLRATALSAIALLTNILLAVCNIFIGRGIDAHGARSVMAIVGLAPLLVAFPLALMLRRERVTVKKEE